LALRRANLSPEIPCKRPGPNGAPASCPETGENHAPNAQSACRERSSNDSRYRYEGAGEKTTSASFPQNMAPIRLSRASAPWSRQAPSTRARWPPLDESGRNRPAPHSRWQGIPPTVVESGPARIATTDHSLSISRAMQARLRPRNWPSALGAGRATRSSHFRNIQIAARAKKSESMGFRLAAVRSDRV
jgi:hypothetical protein